MYAINVVCICTYITVISMYCVGVFLAYLRNNRVVLYCVLNEILVMRF